MISVIVLDAIWFSLVLPAIVGQSYAVHEAQHDLRDILEQNINGGIRILVNGAVRREYVRLAFHLLMLVIGIVALLSRSTETHHSVRMLVFNALVTLSLIGGQLLQTTNALLDLRDRHRALAYRLPLRIPGPIWLRWLWRFLW